MAGTFHGEPKDLLIVQLNRVDLRSNKINIPIKVQNDINFEKRRYRLKSFIVHEGDSVLSGHYKAYSYSERRVVRQFDDMGLCGIPLFVEIQDQDQVQQELKNAYILFYELLPAGEEVEEVLFPPLETPPRTKNMESPARNPVSQFWSRASIQEKSPEASQSPKNKRLQAYQQDLDRQKRIKFSPGSVKDVIFVGKEGEVWSKDNLLNFFVVIPESTILQFRVAHKSIGELKTKQLLDYLLTPTGLPFLVPAFKNKLYYRDAQLQPDVDVLSFPPAEEKKGNVTFILEQQDMKLNHSGLLWTCSKCEGETSIGDDQTILLKGYTKLEKFTKSKQHNGHTLQFSDLLNGKSKWGCPQDKNVKPYGCPVDQPAAPRKVVSQVPAATAISSQDSADEPTPLTAPPTTRSGRQRRLVYELGSDSESDVDHVEDMEQKRKVSSKPVPKQRIKNLDKNADTEGNMEAIRQEMGERMKVPISGKKFIPNEADTILRIKQIRRFAWSKLLRASVKPPAFMG